jgi:hypothetical protein
MARFQQITDTTTGITTRVPFTPEEEAARDAEEAVAQQQATVRQAADVERTAALDDVRTRVAAALTRLTQIQTQMAGVADTLDPAAPTPATLAQVRGALRTVALAVSDEARELRAAIRLLGA